MLLFHAIISPLSFQVSIPSGSERLPSSIERINITNCENIDIQADAFSNLTKLQNIHFGGILFLSMGKTNWTQVTQTRSAQEISISIDTVLRLSLSPGALSGLSHPGLRIVVSNVTKCIVSSDAFASGSYIQSVALRHIHDLQLHRNAISADVGQLELDNVTVTFVKPCGPFAGRIAQVHLHSTRIDKLGIRCLHTGTGWGNLTIRSSAFGDVTYFAVAGSVDHVTIEDCRFGRIVSNGWHMTVSTFTMKSTSVQELAADSLAVRFSRSVSLQMCSIGWLRANAFRRLEAEVGGEAELSVRDVTVSAAEAGSLAFSSRTPVAQLDLQLREPCDCGAVTRARWLVSGAAAETAGDERRGLVRQVAAEVRCMAGADSPTLAGYLCGGGCPDRNATAEQCPAPAAAPVGAIAGGVAATLIIIAGVTWRRRGSRRKTKHLNQSQHTSSSREQDKGKNTGGNRDQDKDKGGNKSKDSNDEPVYSEIFETAETRYLAITGNAPGLLGTSSVEAGLSLGDRYEPGRNRRLPRPPSPEYVEMRPRWTRVGEEQAAQVSRADEEQDLHETRGARERHDCAVYQNVPQKAC